MTELTIEEVAEEIRKGARCILQVRHGERPKMDLDDPTFGDALHLTREGVRTARLLGEKLAEFKDDVAFYSSPLTRTRETAACIAEGMGLSDVAIPTEEKLGNQSFFYEDPMEVLKLFQTMEFFNACFTYFGGAKLPGLKDIHAAADDCENWLVEQAGDHRLFIAATHDCYLAAFLVARQAYGPTWSRQNWPRFLDGAAILVYPGGRRRYALVRAGLSHGICGVRPVKGVVFDFGGVMTKSTMPERVKACADEFGIDWPSVSRGFAKYRRLMDGGFIGFDEMYDLIWADAGLAISDEAKARIIEEDYASFLVGSRNDATSAWMRELKAKGFKIGILSNMSHDFAVRFQKVFPDFIALADAVVLSGEERMFKPQKRIYDLLKVRIGLHADELCFIDDSEENCEGARCAGWQAIRFVSTEQAARDFAARYG